MASRPSRRGVSRNNIEGWNLYASLAGRPSRRGVSRNTLTYASTDGNLHVAPRVGA